VLQVLVEGPNPRDPAQASGRTRHNKVAFFPGDGAALKGQLVQVDVQEVRAYTLVCTMAQ
jgi:tRNA-2-methylthio-N6-dimethylallyladenosine synthase